MRATHADDGCRAMAGLTGLRRFLCAAIAAAWAFGGAASAAAPLRLVTDLLPPFENLPDVDAPGFSVEVLRQVFAAMGQEASVEYFPWSRGWMTVSRGERDGMFTVLRTAERARICSFPDEPLAHEKWVFFVRTADAGRLKFSSFDDLVGHDVAIHGPAAGVYSQPTVSPELWDFLRQHHNFIETLGTGVSFRMLAAGRVDYAVSNLSTGMRAIASLGLSGKIEPLLSRSVIEDGFYVCFSKARVAPALVDAFSHALVQFKQTEAFQAIYRKYFP
jgi:polar amino acid transport system substrate-binding protein